MLFRFKVAAWLLFISLLRRILGPHLSGFVAQTDQGLFVLDPEDYFVGGGLLRRGCAGGEELTRLLGFLDEESEVLVVGAHIGTLAIPLAKRARRVQAFEPNPTTYEYLRRNVALNEANNLHIFPLAASEKEETLRFLQSRVNSGGSKREPQHKEEMYYYDSPQTVEVQAVSLDEHLEESDYDLVLMDIEGSEYFALAGMQKILSRTRVLQVEFLPHHLKNVAQVSVAQFLERIQPHFQRLQIPSKNLEVGDPEEMLQVLEGMFQAGEEDAGILFFSDPK